MKSKILLIFLILLCVNFISAEENSTNITITENITSNITWWNSDYSMRQLISVNSNESAFNYSLLLTINKTETMNRDYSDLRFRDINSNRLFYYIESYNETEAKVWVKLDIINGTNYFYMYYNNSNSTSQSNHELAFIFDDDADRNRANEYFSRNAHVSWNSEKKEYTVTYRPDGSGNQQIDIVNMPNMSNVITDFSMRHGDYAAYLQPFFRQPSQNMSCINGYETSDWVGTNWFRFVKDVCSLTDMWGGGEIDGIPNQYWDYVTTNSNEEWNYTTWIHGENPTINYSRYARDGNSFSNIQSTKDWNANLDGKWYNLGGGIYYNLGYSTPLYKSGYTALLYYIDSNNPYIYFNHIRIRPYMLVNPSCQFELIETLNENYTILNITDSEINQTNYTEIETYTYTPPKTSTGSSGGSGGSGKHVAFQTKKLIINNYTNFTKIIPINQTIKIINITNSTEVKEIKLEKESIFKRLLNYILSLLI